MLAFERPGGWLSVTNFGEAPVALPEGEVLIASSPLEGGEDDEILLPGATTAWLWRAARRARRTLEARGDPVDDLPDRPSSWRILPGAGACGLFCPEGPAARTGLVGIVRVST